MVAIHIEHKLDTGILTISQVDTPSQEGEASDNAEYEPMFQFRFECGETGAWFDADLDHDELTSMCPILGELEELQETLSEPPSVAASTKCQNILTLTFAATGKKKTYPVPIELTRRTYAADKHDIMELRLENAKLKNQIVELNECIVKKDQYSRDLVDYIHKLKEYYKSPGYVAPPQYEPHKVEITKEIKFIFDSITDHSISTSYTGYTWTNMIIEHILIEEGKVGINNLRNEDNHNLLHIVRLKIEEYKNLLVRIPRAGYGCENYQKACKYVEIIHDWEVIERKLVQLGC